MARINSNKRITSGNYGMSERENTLSAFPSYYYSESPSCVVSSTDFTDMQVEEKDVRSVSCGGSPKAIADNIPFPVYQLSKLWLG